MVEFRILHPSICNIKKRNFMFWCLLSSLALGLAGVAVYIYYLRKGQFDDPEDVKYQMFRNEENEK